jgi:sugar phosphate isomerase/epimerase
VPKSGVTRDEAWGWMRAGLEEVCRHAGDRGVTVALEPEPGMLVETVDDYATVARDLPGLTLALDLGHCLVTGERDPAAAAREFAGAIGTISIEDMKRGEHVHLAFGEGDMDIPGILDALDEIAFPRLVCVELSRDSHRADVMVPQALRYLHACRVEAQAAPALALARA